MKRLLSHSTAALGLVIAAAVASAATPQPAAEPAPAAVPAAAATDVLRANLDPAVDPGRDFFAYANGGWLRNHPIPATESSWGIGPVVIADIDHQLRTLNEKAASGSFAPGSDARRIGDFWRTAIDEARADALGIKPLQQELDRIARIRTRAELVERVFALQAIGVESLFDLEIFADERDSEQMALHVYQGGLGLPEREYYFSSEAGTVKVRAEYPVHLARLLELTGRAPDDARLAADAVLAFETRLATASRKLEDRRDPEKNYHRMKLAELQSGLTPGIAWARLLAPWQSAPEAIVGEPEYFESLDRELRTTPLAVLVDYLRSRLIDTYASNLGRDFVDEDFRFHRRVVNGQTEPQPRWRRVLRAQGDAIGMMLGRAWVAERFPEPVKQRYRTMFESIRAAYADRIRGLGWMGDATKARALDKLSRMKAKVGYPDRWKDDSGLAVGTESFAANMMSARRWRFADLMARAGKPVDRSEWDMTPQTYSAYYNPLNNEIVLPAAIFIVPGVADADLDDATAYGYTGASTIGHEITHGFDDEGRKFDADGNLKNWWTDDDAAGFTRRAEVLVKQFDAYEPIPGLHINGRASLGENIADFGGIVIALDAFRRTEQFKRGQAKAGLSPLQRYFLGYALGWLDQAREEKLRRQLLSDVHAPPKWRVNGPMSNIPGFYEAFGIQPGAPMFRTQDDRAAIW
jgi:putative endopeptidase